MKLQKTTYDESYFKNPLYKTTPFSKRDYLRHRFVKKYRKSGTLLEIGSAEGYLLKLLSEDFDVKGIEFSEYAYKIAHELVGDKIVHGSIVDYPLEKNKYDVVLALNILEHLDNPKKALIKLNQSMKAVGILIGSVPNNQYLIGTLVTVIGNQMDKTHVNTLKVNQWRKLLKETGFELVEDMGEIVLKRSLSYFRKDIFWPFYTQNYIFIYKKKRTP